MLRSQKETWSFSARKDALSGGQANLPPEVEAGTRRGREGTVSGPWRRAHGEGPQGAAAELLQDVPGPG